MKTSRAIISILLIGFSLSFAQFEWEWQYSTTDEQLNDVYFLNKRIGWIVGDRGIILHTVNGGKDWYQQYSGVTGKLKAVHFLDENRGWVVGDRAMLFTHDGGLTWSKYPYRIITDIECLWFIDDSHGWICGSENIIQKTSDGGTNWDVIYTSVGKFDKIFFLDEHIGWLHSRDNAGHIYMTEDGGYTLQPMSRSRKSFKSFFFLDAERGWSCGGVVGELNKIFGWIDVSNDGADNWRMLYEEGLMHSVRFFDDKYGIALGQKNRGPFTDKIYDVFYKTVDGGVSWESCEPGGNAFHFVTRKIGWVVGNRGMIYKTNAAGGILNIPSVRNSKAKKFKLSQNYPNPFNPRTVIGYRLPAVSDVVLSIYNILGNEVAVLVSEKQAAGTYRVQWDASGFAGGVYCYKLMAGKFQDVKKMVLLR
jgi:photosystem II stability/assembly factor-like uncharacterized protein